MELASLSKVFRGCIAFAVWWVFAVFPAVPFLPIGRTAGSLLGATLMVVFQVISPDEAFKAIDLPILALLFGTMVVSEYLKRADLFRYLGQALSWKTQGGMDLLCRVCLLAALSSALFTNDTTCVVLTSFVLELCRKKNYDPKPFLLALACSSNIGSAATAIGNPQNLVIAVNSGISFGRFVAGVLPAVAVGLVVNTLLLVVVYGRFLSGYDTALPVARAQLSHPEILEDLGNGYVTLTILWNPSTQKCVMSDHGEARRGSPSHENSTEIIFSPGAPSPGAGAAPPSPRADPGATPSPGAGVETTVDNLEGGIQVHSDRTLCQDMTKLIVKEISSNEAPAISESGGRLSEVEAGVGSLGPEHGAHHGTLEVESSPRNSRRAVSGGNPNSNVLGAASVRRRNTWDADAKSQNPAAISDIEKKGEHEHEEAFPKGGISKAFALFTRIECKNMRATMFHQWLKPLRGPWSKHKKRIWKSCVYLVTLGMLAALLAGLSLPWTAMTAAVIMMVLDFSDAGPSLDKVFACSLISVVDKNLLSFIAFEWSAQVAMRGSYHHLMYLVNYALLVFFCGMFIATSGFNETGVPEVFWSAVKPHSQIGTASGVIVLSLVITVLSNVVSNVPTVILLGSKVAASAVSSGASSDKAWLILAWVSTVAGNLTLLGSAANIIVCEQARETQAEKEDREKQSNNLTSSSKGPARATYDLTFWKHLKFGFPSTLIVIAVGLFPIALRKF